MDRPRWLQAPKRCDCASFYYPSLSPDAAAFGSDNTLPFPPKQRDLSLSQTLKDKIQIGGVFKSLGLTMKMSTVADSRLARSGY